MSDKMSEDDEETIYISGLKITPDSLTDGKWVGEDGLTCDITSLSFTVPEHVKGGPYKEQHVMAVLNACDHYQQCPNCKKKITNDCMILMLEQFHIYPALCCSNMIWIRNGGYNNFLNDLA